jgi:hypothetical protein
MEPLPHHYQVCVESRPESRAEISSVGLTPLSSAPPAEFDGPGHLWSPETLLVGAVADCFVLTFKSIAVQCPVHMVPDPLRRGRRIGPRRTAFALYRCATTGEAGSAGGFGSGTSPPSVGKS